MQKRLVVAMFSLGMASSFAQGSIINPGFDEGVLLQVFEPFAVRPSAALPGWAASTGGTPLLYLVYNTTALDSSWISIHDAATPFEQFRPIDGKYSVFVQGATAFAPQVDAVLSQSVNVPSDSKSVFFAARNLNGLDLSFNGQKLNYFEFFQQTGYSYYGADISTYAGGTAEIRFTATPGRSGLIDNVLFSPTAVPEPSVIALFFTGGLFFLTRWKEAK